MTFKHILLPILTVLGFNLKQSYSQDVSIDSGLGYGKSYIIESVEEAHELDISSAASFYVRLRYTPEKWKNQSMGLHIQHFETRVKGITHISSAPVDGFITNTSYFLFFEKSKPFKKSPNVKFINGYNIGWSNESYLTQSEQPPRRNFYASLAWSAGFGFSLNENVSLQVRNMLIVTDVFKGISYLTGNWDGQSAGEDVSNILSVGAAFNF